MTKSDRRIINDCLTKIRHNPKRFYFLCDTVSKIAGKYPFDVADKIMERLTEACIF